MLLTSQYIQMTTSATLALLMYFGVVQVWHVYAIAHPEVERLQSALTAAGIANQPYYRTPIHRQKPMLVWGEGAELPATEEAARNHLAIPMSPVLSQAQAEEVTAAVRSAL